jgi:hypothetical protein
MLLMTRRCPLCREEFEGERCPECSGDADVERLMHDAFRGLLFIQDEMPKTWKHLTPDTYKINCDQCGRKHAANLPCVVAPKSPEACKDSVDREREWDDE